MIPPNCPFVFKIVSSDPNLSGNHIERSELDKQSGFIHLSTGEQIPRTCNLFFADSDSLYIIKFPYAKLQSSIKWEPVPDGELFPHFYGDLATADVESVRRFEKGESSWLDILGPELWLAKQRPRPKVRIPSKSKRLSCERHIEYI